MSGSGMRILFLGYSRFVKKRALNAAIAFGRFDAIAVASRSTLVENFLPPHRALTIYDDYQYAIANFKPDVVYISLINSLHAEWAEKALLAGAHVIVDKPAFLDLSETTRLMGIAKSQNRCLAEAMVYSCHPQLAIAKQLFHDAGTEISRVSAFFTFPPLPNTDYRYQSALGGGSLLDQGPYAASMCRLFMEEAPREVFVTINNHAESGDVEISFSVLAAFSRGRAFAGHFGFDTEYRNAVTLLGKNLSIDINRVATIEPSLENILHISENNQSRELSVPKYDNVVVFFEKFQKAVSMNNYAIFSDEMLQDAALRQRFHRVAREGG